MSYILALDQGTTSSRALLFNRQGLPIASAQQEFPQIYPVPGHVEHDPEAIWYSQLTTAKQVLNQGDWIGEVAALGVTNQRETVVLWDRGTGKPVAPAIVWQSRITAPLCRELKHHGYEELIRSRTGLLLDPYFSATKIQYLLQQHPGLRERAERGEVLCGTVDSFLIWRLTGGRVHATDVSNASRTSLFNIHSLDWDEELLKLFEVPRAMLPEVRPSSGDFGLTDPAIFGRSIPIRGCAGDQQAATFGQGCFQPGEAKNTYGTGCFMMWNTGSQPVQSAHGLLTTIGWQLGNEVTYCLEGSIFIAGAAVQWLRDGLGIIKSSSDVERLAAEVPSSDGVLLVPAFVGLGAPYWDSEARGLLIGLTRGTTAAHIARAAVESMAYQSADLLDAMQRDAGARLQQLRVDGGATANNALLQFQADLLGVQVVRPRVLETTAFGVACLAGLAAGFWHDRADLEATRAIDRVFEPQLTEAERQRLLARWRKAVERSRNWNEE